MSQSSFVYFHSVWVMWLNRFLSKLVLSHLMQFIAFSLQCVSIKFTFMTKLDLDKVQVTIFGSKECSVFGPATGAFEHASLFIFGYDWMQIKWNECAKVTNYHWPEPWKFTMNFSFIFVSGERLVPSAEVSIQGLCELIVQGKQKVFEWSLKYL